MENAVPIVTQAPGGQPLQIQPGLLTQVQTFPSSPWRWRTMRGKLIIPLCVSWMHCCSWMWLWKRAISMTHFVLMNYNSPPLTKSFSFSHILYRKYVCECHKSWTQSLLPGWAFCLHWNSALMLFFPWSESQSWSDEHDRGRLSERSMDADGILSLRGHKAGPALDWWCLTWTSWIAGGGVWYFQASLNQTLVTCFMEKRHVVSY